MSNPILTAAEVKQYVTHTLMAFRQDLERGMTESGEVLEPGARLAFHTILYDLTRYFELEPDQAVLVCGTHPDTPVYVAVIGNEGKNKSGHGEP